MRSKWYKHTQPRVVVSRASHNIAIVANRNKTELDSVSYLISTTTRAGPLCVGRAHRNYLRRDQSRRARKLINSTEHFDVHVCLRQCRAPNESEIVSRTAAKLTEIHCVVGRARRLWSRLPFAVPPLRREILRPWQKCERVIPYHVTQTDGRVACYREIHPWRYRVASR